MRTILVIGLGGFIGAIARHLTSIAIDRDFRAYFPFGTMLVNFVGCVLLGFIAEGCRRGLRLEPEHRHFLIAGLIGAFTTFSAVCLDTIELAETGHLSSAVANMFGSALLGLVAIVVGQAIARGVL
ncbi:MAG: fluoride efflux transporter CrcB [Planctomycetes bacterium]|nr:fluoride efflux transporter CrcB [Planctomycetota bacterium]